MPCHLSESSEEEKAAKGKEKKAIAREYVNKREEVLDLNSSFDDIDTKYLAKTLYKEAAVKEN